MKRLIVVVVLLLCCSVAFAWKPDLTPKQCEQGISEGLRLPPGSAFNNFTGSNYRLTEIKSGIVLAARTQYWWCAYYGSQHAQDGTIPSPSDIAAIYKKVTSGPAKPYVLTLTVGVRGETQSDVKGIEAVLERQNFDRVKASSSGSDSGPIQQHVSNGVFKPSYEWIDWVDFSFDLSSPQNRKHLAGDPLYLLVRHGQQMDQMQINLSRFK